MTVRQWWALARPATLPASVVPVAVGAAVAAERGPWSWPLSLVMLVVALLLQIGTNMVNEWADFHRGVDAPDSVGIAGVIVAGHLSPATVWRWAVGTYALAFGLGLGLVAVRGWPLLALGLAGIGAGFLYNAGPRPLSATPWGEALVFAIMGPVEVLASEVAAAGTISPGGWAASVAVGFSVAAILTANNLRDRDKDGARGRRTLAVLLGDRGGARLLAALVAAPFLWLALAAGLGWLPVTVLAAWLAVPVAVAGVRRLMQPGPGRRRAVAVVGRIHLLAGLLLAMGLLLAR
ncbi:1,4-dihydroxy-2-naphthoate octaprenyltransferase [Candidatus Hydrogenisulfobacillus filiaventi]|uniref:1,4-dihydroxy-2-naphthoate octaprenyltransferase n=1 Tax=Candidatus Hydrogenisulfobacillus filiaventi TaxID=2707344 RepID=A0A6F8ZEQ8_9FIRM|nr:1,4-dihydroxy-2-naphthoate octaprenyltransferase [Bacillota bacterium]CAB1128257.1 1,4-dihydroxy-2-naphthoate octaprenyltransferase [Candidatus Hydrogenisulfobacillus filiaventi]